MSYEVGYLREGVATTRMLANIRLLLIMYSLMLLQARVLDESVTTLQALIRSFSSVRPQMLLERLLARKEFVAAFVCALKVSSLLHFTDSYRFFSHMGLERLCLV